MKSYTIVLTESQLKMAARLLGRVQISGAEAREFLSLVSALKANRMSNKPEQQQKQQTEKTNDDNSISTKPDGTGEE